MYTQSLPTVKVGCSEGSVSIREMSGLAMAYLVGGKGVKTDDI